MCSSPKLIAAYHVLHRLSDPRHPPYALICFKNLRVFNVADATIVTRFTTFFQYVKELDSNNRMRRCYGIEPKTPPNGYILNPKGVELVMCNPNLGGGYRSRTDDPPDISRDASRQHRPYTFYCGGYRSRTDDPLRARQML